MALVLLPPVGQRGVPELPVPELWEPGPELRGPVPELREPEPVLEPRAELQAWLAVGLGLVRADLKLRE